jgi:hypothetical protein
MYREKVTDMVHPIHESYSSLIPVDPGVGPPQACALPQCQQPGFCAGLSFPSHYASFNFPSASSSPLTVPSGFSEFSGVLFEIQDVGVGGFQISLLV